MNNEKIKKALRSLAYEKVPADVEEIADEVSGQFKRDLAKTELNLWERIMNNPMTKYVAAAAILVIVVFAGAQIFTPLGKNEIAQEPNAKMPVLAEVQQNTYSELDAKSRTVKLTKNQLAEELEDIKRMFAAGNIDGVEVETTFDRNGQRLWQKQLAVQTPGKPVLMIFTLSALKAFTEEDEARWSALKQSLTLNDNRKV